MFLTGVAVALLLVWLVAQRGSRTKEIAAYQSAIGREFVMLRRGRQGWEDAVRSATSRDP